MSESSDSDYNVEDYIKPEVVRRTYNNEDLLTDDDEDDDSESSEAHSDHEVNNSQCKVKKAEKPKREDEDEQEEEIEAPRANSRYILYVTNLSPETTRSMLEDFFTDAGQIKSIRIPKVRLGSFAFVEMMDIEGFKKGLMFNNKELDDRKIQVYPGSKNKKHTSIKSKNLKRKVQQEHLSKIKLRKQTTE